MPNVEYTGAAGLNQTTGTGGFSISDAPLLQEQETITATAVAQAANVFGATNLVGVAAMAGGVTLADGTGLGQEKVLVMTDATNSVVVTVENHALGAATELTFAAVDQTVVLVWQGSHWFELKNSITQFLII